MEETKDGFRKEYSFLSNMYKRPVMYRGVECSCAETAYQLAKIIDTDIWEEYKDVFPMLSGKDAKEVGNCIPLDGSWENKKIKVMEEVLRAKFINDDLMKYYLKQTEGILLVEYNAWGDNFWGIYRGSGQNMLGQLLMELRREILGGN